MALFLPLIGCAAPEITQADITASIKSDGEEITVVLPAGSNVQQALEQASINLGEIDKVSPPLFTQLSRGAEVRVVRVREEFEVEQVVIPFEGQIVRNESLPEGEARLVQSGINGLQEITYRIVFEDGFEISRNQVKVITLRETEAEIIMIGSQLPFSSLPIQGRLAYLLSGNAWVMEGNTGNRRMVVSTGDLDGRVFLLSPDRSWLLFTRQDSVDGSINLLWAVKLDEKDPLLVDLLVSNVIHYAGWQPGSSYTIAYSTVEPRSSAPGWQANNDLNLISLNEKGQVEPLSVELETNTGGIYGWWGMSFSWAPDGQRLAYARPDSVGVLNVGGEDLTPLIDLLEFQSGGDWAWAPGLSWSPDGKLLYTVEHLQQPGIFTPEQSPLFDLSVIKTEGGMSLRLVPQTGMFAYPITSPLKKTTLGEDDYQVAFLQAITPERSENSRYRLVVMDRDGSNRQVLFPAPGREGIEPRQGWGAWSPVTSEGSGDHVLSVLYQNNLWLVEVESGQAFQITGDNSVTAVDWK